MSSDLFSKGWKLYADWALSLEFLWIAMDYHGIKIWNTKCPNTRYKSLKLGFREITLISGSVFLGKECECCPQYLANQKTCWLMETNHCLFEGRNMSAFWTDFGVQQEEVGGVYVKHVWESIFGNKGVRYSLPSKQKHSL